MNARSPIRSHGPAVEQDPSRLLRSGIAVTETAILENPKNGHSMAQTLAEDFLETRIGRPLP